MNFDDLPVLGLGASLSLNQEPNPLELIANPKGPNFIEYAGLVDVDHIWPHISQLKDTGTPVLFHPSYINFCGSFTNSKSWLNATKKHIEKVGSPWFAQDCAYCFWGDTQGYSSQFGYFIPPILNKTSLLKAKDRIREVMDVVQKPVAIEPPPVSFVAGSMQVMEFFGELAEAVDCALLLDMGHLVSYEMASGISTESQLDFLPKERVIEVHIAGGKKRELDDGPIYIDAHESPILDETWQCLSILLPHLHNLKALCFECEGVEEHTVLNTLSKIRGFIKSNAHENVTSRIEFIA